MCYFMSEPNACSAELTLEYKGSASMRKGTFFAITGLDEVPIALEKTVNAVKFDETKHVALRLNQVITACYVL